MLLPPVEPNQFRRVGLGQCAETFDCQSAPGRAPESSWLGIPPLLGTPHWEVSSGRVRQIAIADICLCVSVFRAVGSSDEFFCRAAACVFSVVRLRCSDAMRSIEGPGSMWTSLSQAKICKAFLQFRRGCAAVARGCRFDRNLCPPWAASAYADATVAADHL